MAYNKKNKSVPITMRASALKYTGNVDLVAGARDSASKYQQLDLGALSDKEELDDVINPGPDSDITTDEEGGNDGDGTTGNGPNNNEAISTWLSSKDEKTGLTWKEITGNLNGLWKK